MIARRARSVLALVVVVTFLGLLTACGGDGSNAAATKVKIVASTNVWGSVASAIGGDQVAVKSIIDDPVADPHSYEATALDALAVREAELVITNGGGYDEFMTTFADQPPAENTISAYDLAATGDENEHVWFSFTAVAKVADQVAAKLANLRPTEGQLFLDNANTFKARLDDVRKKAEQIGTTHPGKKVVATEPVAHYLLLSAGVSDQTPAEFAEAVEAETDVPAAALNQTSQLVSNRQVDAVISNSQTSTPATDKLIVMANENGVPVVSVTETLPPGNTDYIGWITTEVDTLARILGG